MPEPSTNHAISATPTAKTSSALTPRLPLLIAGFVHFALSTLPLGEVIEASSLSSSSPAVDGRRLGSRSMASWRTAPKPAGSSGATSRTFGGGSYRRRLRVSIQLLELNGRLPLVAS